MNLRKTFKKFEKTSIKRKLSSHHSVCFLPTKILISACLSARGPQVANIFQQVVFRFSSSGKLPQATASLCLNTLGRETVQNEPEINWDQSQLTPHRCSRERQLLSGWRLSTLQLQLQEIVIVWNYLFITGMAKMIMPFVWNNVQAIGVYIACSFWLSFRPYVRPGHWKLTSCLSKFKSYQAKNIKTW